MKKLVFIVALVFGSTGLFAQLKVVSTGQVQVGNFKDTTSVSSPTIGGTTIITGVFPDSKAQLRILGNGKNKTNGKIAFGDSGHVSISESANSKGNGMFKISATGGLIFKSGNNTIFEYDNSIYNLEAHSSSFNFSCAVSAPQYLTVSDSRAKTDIEPLEDMGQLLRISFL